MTWIQWIARRVSHTPRHLGSDPRSTDCPRWARPAPSESDPQQGERIPTLTDPNDVILFDLFSSDIYK